jgi:lipopolysaccharide/colanic/teichoic acid biosynthesis glycosyltransferase
MIKRVFDVIVSLGFLILLAPLVMVSWLLACIDTGSSGIFLQERIGQFGKPFIILKLRTIQASSGKTNNIGAFLRRAKLDEFPQLINVIKGDMSLVGPRPDLMGYYDRLQGENKKVTMLKPGLTSLAALKYWDEEKILSKKGNGLNYNETILFPDKVKLNMEYYYNRSLLLDIKIIARTILFFFRGLISQ